jgi:glutamate-ammonia-ligase adenylyltransferase
LLRILVRDIQGLLSVRDVADELSMLADSILALAIPMCWRFLQSKLRGALQDFDVQHHFAVIAYGKLGGKELGYGSDLDVVFLYDDESDLATERYTALVRKLINWLTAKTSEGDLYEIDTALRPNGNSGLLVQSIRSYETYQLQRGSNTAWTWELQAMTRARCVFGSQALRHRFDDIRAEVLSSQRDTPLLKTEVIAMRQKLYAAYPAPAEQFDIKHSAGGMMDAEFAVQYLILAHAKNHPALLGNVGTIELLRIAEVQQLLPAGVGARAADAYQLLRDKQHAARLQEQKACLPKSELKTEREAVLALWNATFDHG